MLSAALDVVLDIPDGSSEGLTFTLEVDGNTVSNNTVTIANGTREISGVINVDITSGPPGGVAANAPTSIYLWYYGRYFQLLCG